MKWSSGQVGGRAVGGGDDDDLEAPAWISAAAGAMMKVTFVNLSNIS